MFCPNCETKNEADALFCFNCGVHLEDNSTSHTSRYETVPPAQKEEGGSNYAVSWVSSSSCPTVEANANYVDNYKRAAVVFANEIERRHYANEAKRLRNSLLACRALGIALALISIYSMTSGFSPTTNIGFACIIGVNMYFIPYGLTPILRWTSSHGFFIVFNWIFIICALCLLLVTAIIAGPIYAIWAHIKIREYDALLSR